MIVQRSLQPQDGTPFPALKQSAWSRRPLCRARPRARYSASAGDVRATRCVPPGRRACLAALLLTASTGAFSPRGLAEADDLVDFTNKKRTYSLRRPKEWVQVDKAGADALFKAPNLRSTDLGVTVSPVRIKRLGQLGDVGVVGDRLLAAEKKKDSTNSAELLAKETVTAESGMQFYELDYTVSTTRGDKRILSKVGVADGELFIVNGSIKCEGETCKADTPLVDLVRRSVRSFDIKS